MKNRGMVLNGEIITLKAQKLVDEANQHLPYDQRLRLKLSKGCKERFKKRYGLQFHHAQGEAKSADQDAIKGKMPAIH